MCICHFRSWIDIFCIFFCILTIGLGQSNQSEIPPYKMEGTHHLTLKAKSNGINYHLFVGLPKDYEKSDKRYPVLYLTDGDMFFPAAKVIYQLSIIDQEIPEIIIVSIGYDAEMPNEFDKFVSERKRDFTPTFGETMKGSGGAKLFSKFIREEVISVIDSNYRTDTSVRTLSGASLGGLFACYVLFHSPDAFDNYIILSPSLWWDDQITFKYEASYAKNNNDLPITLYTAVGELEDKIKYVDIWYKFVSTLESRNYKGLELKKDLIKDLNHALAINVAYNLALKTVFSKPESNQ